MNAPEVSRRRALQLSGTAGIAALAGCTGLLGGDGGGAPDYAAYASPNDGQATVVYIDVQGLSELEDSESGNESDSDQSFEDIEDPLLSLASAGIFAASFSGVALQGAGLGPLLNTTQDSDASEFESEVREWILAGDAFVAAGSIATDEIDETITSEPEDQFFGVQYERVEEMSGYDIYEGPGGTTGDQTGEGGTSTIALSGDEIISGGSRDSVVRAVETISGDRTAAVDEFDTLDWALSNAGDHQIAFAGHGESIGETSDSGMGGNESGQDFPELTGARSATVGLTYDGDSKIDGEAAVVFESSDALGEVRSGLEESFGSEAEDQSFDFGDDRFSMSATYDETAL